MTNADLMDILMKPRYYTFTIRVRCLLEKDFIAKKDTHSKMILEEIQETQSIQPSSEQTSHQERM